MNTIRIAAQAAVVGLIVSLAAPLGAVAANHHAKTVTFKGSYSGTAQLVINDSSISIKSVSGSGTATVNGVTTKKATLSGTGSATAGQSSCIPWNGKGTLKGAFGSLSISTTTKTAQGCSSGESGPVTVTVKGTAKVTAGTGQMKGASGTMTFNGALKLNDTSGSQTGTFKNVTISGKLSLE